MAGPASPLDVPLHAHIGVLLILDCCFSGSIGNPPNLQGEIENQALLREGVTILAASRPAQVSMEVGGHGVFTKLVMGALRGGQRTFVDVFQQLPYTPMPKLRWEDGINDHFTNRTRHILNR
jgi:uncharacterized caspase-like protein